MIRQGTQHQRSLDDAMRALWQQYGKSEIGVGEEELELVIAQVAGLDLHSFFDQALRATEDMLLPALLDTVGVEMVMRAAQSSQDKGGKPADGKEQQVELGARYIECEGAVKLTHILDGGAAQLAGLSAGDILVAVDGVRAKLATLESGLPGYTPGEVVSIHAFRRDELMVTEVALQKAPLDTCYLRLVDAVDEQTSRDRIHWLGRDS
jgi:predicted metalloprotease with PDZ domain